MIDLLSRLDGNGKAKRWIKRHLDYSDRDWCLLWPFGRIQSGYAGFGKPWTAVHRFMCEVRNGPPPTPKHQAAHSCGRGPDGCVNPWHLSWKTNAENQIERFQHSGTNPQRKLTLQQVEEIRSLKDLMPINDIARRFNVTALNIHRIHAGKLWRKDNSSHRHIFTVDEVLRVRSSAFGEVGVVKGLAEEFGVSPATIHRIRSGESYKHVQPEITRPDTSQLREAAE